MVLRYRTAPSDVVSMISELQLLKCGFQPEFSLVPSDEKAELLLMVLNQSIDRLASSFREKFRFGGRGLAFWLRPSTALKGRTALLASVLVAVLLRLVLVELILGLVLLAPMACLEISGLQHDRRL